MDSISPSAVTGSGLRARPGMGTSIGAGFDRIADSGSAVSGSAKGERGLLPMGARTKALLLATGLTLFLALLLHPERVAAQYVPGEPPLDGSALPPPRPLPPAVPAPGPEYMPAHGMPGTPIGLPPGGMTMPPFGAPWAPAAPTDPPVPTVAIRVRVNAQAQPDQDIEYHIEVENTSRAPAHHVLVSDPLPDTATFVRAEPSPTTPEPKLTWKLGTLAPYARKKILVVLKANGKGDIESCARVQFEYGQRVRTRLARPALRLRMSGPATVQRNDAVTFRLEVTNVGKARAADVVIEPKLPESLDFIDWSSDPKNAPQWKVGTLEPGQTKRHEFSASAKKPGKLVARAIAHCAGLKEEASAAVFVGEAKLAIIKKGPQTRSVKRSTPYLITVINTGTAPATNVKLIDDLGRHNKDLRKDIEFQSASANGERTDAEVKWSLGILQPGERRTVQLVIRANVRGELTNRAIASADHGVKSGEAASPKTHFETATGVVIEIDKDHDPVQVGQETSYIVRVWNAGQEAANKLGTKITVPPAMQVVGTPSGRTAVEQNGQTIRFAPLGTLSPGEEVEYKLRLKAVQAGVARLGVELTSGDFKTPRTGADTTTIEASASPAPPPAPSRSAEPPIAPPLMPSSSSSFYPGPPRCPR
jgi:uncharacterized repeat protein (TIGR01451 family)